MPKHLLLICIIATYTLLAACGTKGPLYIPEQRYPQKVEQPAEQEKPSQPANY
jgi:predicted small lipoprotein YifL